MNKPAELNFEIEKAVIGNSDLKTTQAFIFTRHSEEGKIQFIGFVTASGEDIFTKIRHLGPVFEESLSQFNTISVDQFFDYLASLLAKKLAESPDGFNYLLAAISTDTLYLKSSGDFAVNINREGKTLHPLNENNHNKLISGYLKEVDQILISSSMGYLEEETRKSLTEGLFLDEDLESTLDTFVQNKSLEIPFAVVRILDPTQKKESAEIKPIEPASVLEHHRKLSLPKIKFKFGILKVVFKYIFKWTGFLLAYFYYSKRIVKAGVIVFIILFFGGLMILVNSYQGNLQKGKEINRILAEAKASFDNAQKVKDHDAEQAKNFLIETNEKIKKAEKIDQDNSNIVEFKKTVELSSNQILKVADIKDWQSYLDLNLIRPDFSTSRLSISLGKLLLLDEKQKSLVLLDIEKKNNQLLAGPQQLGDATLASLNGGSAFVFSKDKGLLRVETTTRKVFPLSEVDPDWGGITDVFGFSANVYLLDSLKNQIWKYVGGAGGFSKYSYLNDGQPAAFLNARRLIIDYSVWVTTPQPEIYKYTGGDLDNFSLNGLDEPLKTIKAIFVTEDLDNVYLLDADNSRIVVTNKAGKYLHQYKGEKFKSASDFVVNEDTKKILLLDGATIYQIPLFGF